MNRPKPFRRLMIIRFAGYFSKDKGNRNCIFGVRMGSGKLILPENRISLIIDRLCHELIENYSDFKNTCLVGIQPRGVFLSDRINSKLRSLLPECRFPYGKLDITFYRDDFRTHDKPLVPKPNDMEFLVENQRVILIDDVLYTGRTVHAALTALQYYGRPREVELLVLIDRRFHRQLPIQSNYTGSRVDALDEAFVKVEWREINGHDQVLLFASKEEKEKAGTRQ